MFTLNTEVIFQKPIYIFKIENFLDTSFYENLKNNFPKVEKELFIKKMNTDGKFGINSEGITREMYLNLYNNNLVLKKFHDLITNRQFYNNILNKLYFEIIKSNLDVPLRALKYTRPYKKVEEKDLNFNFFISNFYINIEYSHIKNNGEIIPHTDSIKKILTMMLYFPDDENDLNYGTSFIATKKKNFSNTHIRNIKDLLNEKSSKILYKTMFKKNTLYGFIRNNQSWHFVEKQNIREEYTRKSININFILKN